MRASRLLSILIMLQLRGRMSAADLASEFEVSVRTIHRDIDRLSAAGVPVYAERGREGGFRLHEGYRTRLTGLSMEEAQVVMLGGLGAVAAELGVAPELGSARLKLAASLPPEQGASARRIEERFLFDPTDWYRSRQPPLHLHSVAQAVWRGQRLKIAYESWVKRSVRVVDPLGIVLKAGEWYLVAAVQGGVRTYRVLSIQAATIEQAPCRAPKRFRLQDYWRKRVEEFEKSLLTDTAHVRLTVQGARRLSELSAAAATALLDARAGRDGCIEARIPIEGIDQVASLFARLGDDVEVIAPARLRKKLCDMGERLVARYARS